MCTEHRPRQWTFVDVLASKRTAQHDSECKGWYNCLIASGYEPQKRQGANGRRVGDCQLQSALDLDLVFEVKVLELLKVLSPYIAKLNNHICNLL